MAQTIKFKRGTAAALAAVAATLVPAEGEPVFETDTKKFKIGDGTTTYGSLPYQTATAITEIDGGVIEAAQTPAE